MGESISDLHILSSRGVREKKELFANTSKKMKGMMVSYGSYMGKHAEAEVRSSSPILQSRPKFSKSRAKSKAIMHNPSPVRHTTTRNMRTSNRKFSSGPQKKATGHIKTGRSAVPPNGTRPTESQN